MKKILTTMIILAGGLIFMSFTVPKQDGTTPKKQKANIVIPEGVHALIMKHCYMCHNTKSKDKKPKKKLNFDLLTQMPLPSLVGKLQGIYDVVDSSKMPPKRFLEHHPDKDLSAMERSTLANWAISSADSLMKNK